MDLLGEMAAIDLAPFKQAALCVMTSGAPGFVSQRDSWASSAFAGGNASSREVSACCANISVHMK